MKTVIQHSNPLTFDEPAIRAHVALLHDRADGLDGVLVVSTFFANAGDKPGPITHHAIGDVDGMVAAITAHAATPGVNVYTGLHVMRRGLERGKRGTERDIVAVLGVVADMDGDTGKTGEMPVAADLVLETSPGNHQPFILFDAAATPSEAREIGAALRAATGADHGTVDPTHVWRIPGTLNWPNAAKRARGRDPEPALVVVIKPYAGTLQSIDEIRTALAPWAGKVREAAPVALGELPDVSDVFASGTAAAMLAASGVGDRSAHAAKVVERLAFDGHTPEAAAALFLSASGDWFDRYGSGADAERDFSRLWAKFGATHQEARNAGADAAARLTAINDNDDAPDLEDLTMPAVLHSSQSLADFTHPGGLVEDLVDWIVSSSPTPSRELALGAVLSLIAALAGRRYSTGQRDTRCNSYIVALAPSGFGKDHARQQLKRLAADADGWLDPYFGPERIMSASALRSALERWPSTVCLIDEFGGFVSEILDKRAGEHKRAISTDLRDYFSASNTNFAGAEYAKTKASRIYNPNLNIYGTATPGQFWSALGSASAADGLLPRMILFDVGDTWPAVVEPAADVRDVPADLVARLLAIAGIQPKIDDKRSITEIIDGTAKAGGKKPLDPIVINWTDEAIAAMKALAGQCRDAARTSSEIRAPFINRLVEHATKFALIRAIASDRRRPLIDMETWEWASGLATHCITRMVSAVEEYVADSDREELHKAIAAVIRKAGDAGVSRGVVIDKLPKKFTRSMRDEVLDDLIESRRVQPVETSPPPGRAGRKKLRLFWRG